MVARFMLKTSNAVNDVIRRLDEEAFRNALPDDGREHVVRCVQELRTLAGDPSVAAAELATLQASLEPVLTVCRDFLACADTHGVPSEEMNDATPILTSGFSPELEAALKALPNQFLAFTAAVAIAQGSTADLPRATPSVITAADQTAEIVYDPSKHATVAQVFTAKVCVSVVQRDTDDCGLTRHSVLAARKRKKCAFGTLPGYDAERATRRVHSAHSSLTGLKPRWLNGWSR